MDKINIYILLLVILKAGNISNSPCNGDYQCVRIKDCLTENDIVLPCNDVLYGYICCSPEKLAQTNLTTPIITRSSEFSSDCGGAFLGDRITGGDRAEIGQFPWMALLGYKSSGIDALQFWCGGSLISPNYILSAAHCMKFGTALQVIRLGEHNTDTELDCYGEGQMRVCAEKPLDVLVDKIIFHEKYNSSTLENDIALVKMQTKVTFTENIRPICLPFNITLDHARIANKNVTISGWGLTNSGDYRHSATLLYANIKIWNRTRCNSALPSSMPRIKNSQICANGEDRKDSCKGDSGGPMTNYTIDGGGRNYQIGIVSFSSSPICGNPELPTIYTKVDYYLDWIVNKVNTN